MSPRRGCGRVGVASGPGKNSWEVGNYGSCKCVRASCCCCFVIKSLKAAVLYLELPLHYLLNCYDSPAGIDYKTILKSKCTQSVLNDKRRLVTLSPRLTPRGRPAWMTTADRLFLQVPGRQTRNLQKKSSFLSWMP